MTCTLQLHELFFPISLLNLFSPRLQKHPKSTKNSHQRRDPSILRCLWFYPHINLPPEEKCGSVGRHRWVDFHWKGWNLGCLELDVGGKLDPQFWLYKYLDFFVENWENAVSVSGVCIHVYTVNIISASQLLRWFSHHWFDSLYMIFVTKHI